MSIETLTKQFETYHGEIKGLADSLKATHARLDDIERKANRFGGAPVETKTAGQLAVKSEQFETLAREKHGTARITLESKALITTADVGNAVRVDRESDIQALARKPLMVRELLNNANTTAKSVEYTRQTGFTNAAAPVAEGALKPESSVTYAPRSADVKTIAHWIPASIQVLDDTPALADMIDSDLRYGLADEVEQQLLNGSGIGENLHGLIPNATDYNPAGIPAGATNVDTLAWAILQSELAKLPATGIILHPQDWWAMLLLKKTDGSYLSGGAFEATVKRVWTLPVATSLNMAPGTFLVGNFADAATVYTRQDATVQISTEDRDNFIRNQVTIRGEERLALAVKRPESIIFGEF